MQNGCHRAGQGHRRQGRPGPPRQLGVTDPGPATACAFSCLAVLQAVTHRLGRPALRKGRRPWQLRSSPPRWTPCRATSPPSTPPGHSRAKWFDQPPASGNPLQPPWRRPHGAGQIEGMDGTGVNGTESRPRSRVTMFTGTGLRENIQSGLNEPPLRVY